MDFLSFDVAPSELVIRGVAVFLFVVILIRLAGKRQLGQMSATEFVAILLISNAVQNAMNGGDNSLIAGLFLALILVALSWGIAWINFRSRRIRAIFEGTPRLLMHKGEPIIKNLHKEMISLAELKTMLRKQGVHDFSDVRTAILESDGTLTIDRHTSAPGASAHRV